MPSDIQPGAMFPFELTDHTGTPRRLLEVQSSDPMILVLFPYEPTRATRGLTPR